MKNSKRILIKLTLPLCVACSEPDMSNYEVLKTKEIRCPDGARVEYQPWGPNGLMAACKLDHGPFLAAEKGRLVLEAEYYMGQKIGKIKLYDKNGKIEKVENFE
jgi:antitoxin component YwqK of YwqJK toxin-antitoxin module